MGPLSRKDLGSPKKCPGCNPFDGKGAVRDVRGRLMTFRLLPVDRPRQQCSDPFRWKNEGGCPEPDCLAGHAKDG